MAKKKQYLRPASAKAIRIPDGRRTGPLLSIGIIFKNEIRCLERCLSSLQPLRDAIPCQLVMADTGSDDGSREVAERYADVLFDFPWVDDFAAARNAVLDRCKGAWTLCIDCDEWLTDVSELLAFLRDHSPTVMMAEVVQRNYKSADFKGMYLDFMTFRLFRMRDKPRYEGAIHESVVFPAERVKAFSLMNTILHHDGYLNMDSEAGKARRERNLPMIRKELERNPDDLFRIMQYAESGYAAPDCLEMLKRGMAATERKAQDWRVVGPVIFSYAAQYAFAKKMEDFDAWIQKAEELFPESYHVRLDINALRCFRDYNRKAYRESAEAGERYLKALSKFDSDGAAERRIATFPFRTEIYGQSVRATLMRDFFLLGRTRDALDMLKSIRLDWIQSAMFPVMLHTLADMQRTLDEDFAPHIVALWEQRRRVLAENESEEKREQAFLQTAKEILLDSVREEAERAAHDTPDGQGFHRPAYTLFLPLAGQCPVGDWAKILTLDDPDALSDCLSRQDVLTMPAPVLLHALSRGAAFPIPDRPMTPEEIGTLCESLRPERDALISLALDAAKSGYAADWQSLLWTECLTFAAFSVCDWAADTRRYELFRAFAAAEKTFIPRYYAPQAVENLRVLPLRHRSGWRCAQAVEALDNGDFAVCVARLRDALQEDNRMAQAVNFMLEAVSRRERVARTPPELREMAAQMRKLLASLNPDAPEVRQLKESPAYQQLAWLIEE